MKLQMHSVHFEADHKLTDFIQKRADKLETFYDGIIDGEVIMRVEPDEHHQTKTVEMKVNIPGDQLFAEKKAGSFEAATDDAVEALRRQLKRFKEKNSNR
jgi:putative sigma-54 modulation protein